MANITVTNRQILQLQQLLGRLDPGTSDNRAKSAFSFKAKVAYAFARNLKRLKNVVEDLEKTRVDTFKKYRVGEEETLTGEAAKEFNKEFGEVLDETVDFKFHSVDINELELDKNNVNTEILAELLDTIVVGEPA